ncbi:MAG: hypothetical protein NTV06_05625 [candidate division Zixibacteria bacterium]|nr:hypothetical protein [candidate division Zixibacteria bacterium]
MTYTGGGESAAIMAAAQAKRAYGQVIYLESDEFQKILSKLERPMVVVGEKGFLSSKLQYLISYKGFIFHTKTADTFQFPSGAEFIKARKIWNPSF